MKKLISLILSLILTGTCVLPTFAENASSTDAGLYNYYGDNMLFKQYNEAIFAGIEITNKKLERTTGFIFNFEGEGLSDLSIDHIRFAPEEGNENPSFDVDSDNAETFLEKLSAFFTKIFGFIVGIFI